MLKLLILPVIAGFFALLNFETTDLFTDNFELKFEVFMILRVCGFCKYLSYFIAGKVRKCILETTNASSHCNFLNFEIIDLLTDNFKIFAILAFYYYYPTYMVDGKASKSVLKTTNASSHIKTTDTSSHRRIFYFVKF